MTVKILANGKGNPPGKLAARSSISTPARLAGLRLIGFRAPRRR
jgi:hypothetical protein